MTKFAKKECKEKSARKTIGVSLGSIENKKLVISCLKMPLKSIEIKELQVKKQNS